MFHYVYLLESQGAPGRHYTGMTTNLEQRLAEHNSGKCPHTRPFRPWSIASAIAFHDRDKAVAFERYLKTHSGRAFAKKHL